MSIATPQKWPAWLHDCDLPLYRNWFLSIRCHWHDICLPSFGLQGFQLSLNADIYPSIVLSIRWKCSSFWPTCGRDCPLIISLFKGVGWLVTQKWSVHSGIFLYYQMLLGYFRPCHGSEIWLAWVHKDYLQVRKSVTEFSQTHLPTSYEPASVPHQGIFCWFRNILDYH